MYKRKVALVSLLAGVLSLVPAGIASAHVVVRPAEALTAGFQTFTVSTPNEKDVPSTSLKLLIPNGLKEVSPTAKPGWQIDVEKAGSGEQANVTAITWSGSAIPVGFREDFTFSAQVPAKATELQWKAFQAYENGETIAWDLAKDQQPKKTDGSPDFSKSGPFSVTKVTTETEADARLKQTEQATADAKIAAKRALYIGVAGLAVGLIGISLASRKKV
jgi:uncharacterized protein YcnI